MEAATVAPEQAEQNGAPVDGAEATRSTEHLFAYSMFVHVGAGAQECEHAEDGKCEDPAHFHAWLRLPNVFQRQDILDKARAAKARRRRALEDPESDAYVICEAELDELMAQEREPLLREMAEREAGKGAVERVRELVERDERFQNYWQDMEELERLKALPEPTEETAALEALAADFGKTLDEDTERVTEREQEALRSLDAEAIRARCREVRITGETNEAHMRAYYLWMGFICVKDPLKLGASKRKFERLEDYKGASPEVVRAIERSLRDLEGRFQRGEGPGNS